MTDNWTQNKRNFQPRKKKNAMTCTHDIIEKDNACADGMCPICLADKVERLKALLKSALRHVEGEGDDTLASIIKGVPDGNRI